MTRYVAEHLADLPPRMANGVKPTTCIVREMYEVRPTAVGVHTSGEPACAEGGSTGLLDRSRAAAVGVCLALVSASAPKETGVWRDRRVCTDGNISYDCVMRRRLAGEAGPCGAQ
jgi:hypothetical protein